MIESVLIANRGEIACRVIRTCQRLGIRSIAVFSEADANAPHVMMADAKYCIGPAEAARSYLRPDAIIEAALFHGAAAIHPGYGFLSEKIELAELCQKHGILWVGPSTKCIASMGSKIESKRIAERAGVECVPGHHGTNQSPEHLLVAAEAIGFPILIKASAGGGGKGMRQVMARADFLAALDTVKREAKAAFNDDAVLLEKFITRPRHLEVQLAGDKHGNVVHLFERECSVQRNYQKVIEEAPAAHLPAKTRQTLLDAAVRLGKAVAYDSIGTVEFILDTEGDTPYFLEMNTRLQVEHPVTEMITGFDLVELQLRIAAGEPLPVSQDEITAHGSAIEARINAEDPSADYRPNIGRVQIYREPTGEGIRADSGIREGSEITPYYDSMLAKIIAFGDDREVATTRLAAAMDRLEILGIGTNQMFVRDILRSPQFHNDVLSTRFIQDVFPAGWQRPRPDIHIYAAAAVARVIQSRDIGVRTGYADTPWARLAGFRVLSEAGQPARSQIQIQKDGIPAVVAVLKSHDTFIVEINGERIENLTLSLTTDGALDVRNGSDCSHISYIVEENKVSLFERGSGVFEVTAVPLLEARSGMSKNANAVSASKIVSTMPGLITEVPVSVGQFLHAGETAIVMESMKLSLRLLAPMNGIVEAINCAAGETVAGGMLLLQLTPTEITHVQSFPNTHAN